MHLIHSSTEFNCTSACLVPTEIPHLCSSTQTGIGFTQTGVPSSSPDPNIQTLLDNFN